MFVSSVMAYKASFSSELCMYRHYSHLLKINTKHCHVIALELIILLDVHVYLLFVIKVSLKTWSVSMDTKRLTCTCIKVNHNYCLFFRFFTLIQHAKSRFLDEQRKR